MSSSHWIGLGGGGGITACTTSCPTKLVMPRRISEAGMPPVAAMLSGEWGCGSASQGGGVPAATLRGWESARGGDPKTIYGTAKEVVDH